MRYVFLTIAIFVLIGCAAVPTKDASLSSPAILEPSATLKFADIPYPTGFKLLPQGSYVFENAGIRVGLLKYQGKANVEQVLNFYKEQMLMYNWNLLNIIEYGERLMNFDRDQESCIIGILSKGNNVIITISVGPKSQISKKVEKPVK
jgi:hypothetical protein